VPVLSLLVHAARFGGAGGLRRFAALRADERLADNRGELLARVVEVARLVARELAHDEDAPLRVEARAREGAQAIARRRVEAGAALEVEAELDLRRHLVHVLPARTGRARGGPRELRGRHGKRRVDGQRIGHREPVYFVFPSAVPSTP